MKSTGKADYCDEWIEVSEALLMDRQVGIWAKSVPVRTTVA
jgi:hypothetical protein